MENQFIKNVKFFGNQNVRDELVKLVDQALKENGSFDDFADLSAGLDTIADTYRVEIVDDDDTLIVTAGSIEDNTVSYMFNIDKNTKTVYKPTSELATAATDFDESDEDMDFLDEI